MSFSTFIFSTGINLFIRQLDFIKTVRWLRAACPHDVFLKAGSYFFKCVKYWVLCSIIGKQKQVKVQDMTLTTISMLLQMEANKET